MTSFIYLFKTVGMCLLNTMIQKQWLCSAINFKFVFLQSTMSNLLVTRCP